MIDANSIVDKNIRKFFKHVIKTCKENKVKFFLDPDDDSNNCRGSFNDIDKELRVTLVDDNEGWIGVLVHEYSHLEQWLEQSPIYVAKYRNLDPTSVVDYWLDGKEYGNKTLDACFMKVKELEFDCEKRAVENIKKWKLPIDIPKYIKGAIAYTYYYDFLRNTRNKSSVIPYEEANVLELIEPSFASRDLAIRNLEIEKLIEQNTKQTDEVEYEETV